MSTVTARTEGIVTSTTSNGTAAVAAPVWAQPKELKGKVCLVTGGSRGIGRAIALALGQAGGDVIVNCAHNFEAAQGVAAQIQEFGCRARPVQANVADPAQVQAMVETALREFGPVQVLVNCAGITRDKSFTKMTKQQWDEVLATNLSSLFLVTQAVLPKMLEAGWGRIVNISSIVGQQGNFGQANYAAAKGGMIAFTKTLARELARKGITVNAVCPGFIETDMTKDVPPAVIDQVKAMTPVGRLGKPEEIAAAVAFLSSPRTGYITGQTLGVNGGMYM